MKSFKDLNIKSSEQNFSGKKIDVEDVLNSEIEVHAFKIEDSKKKPGTKYMTLQISVDGVKRVIFTGSVNLMDMIQQVAAGDIPFTAVIKKEEKRLLFT
jgi:hypothetical protein